MERRKLVAVPSLFLLAPGSTVCAFFGVTWDCLPAVSSQPGHQPPPPPMSLPSSARRVFNEQALGFGPAVLKMLRTSRREGAGGQAGTAGVIDPAGKINRKAGPWVLPEY